MYMYKFSKLLKSFINVLLVCFVYWLLLTYKVLKLNKSHCIKETLIVKYLFVFFSLLVDNLFTDSVYCESLVKVEMLTCRVKKKRR